MQNPLLLLTMGLAALQAGLVHAAAEDPVVASVWARDAELAAAHGRGDLSTWRAGLSARYAYIDVGGQRVSADRVEARRGDDHRRVLSSRSSEEEGLRLADDVVLLRGREDSHALYYGVLPRIAQSRWSAVWVREDDGVWRLVAETATPIRNEEALPFVRNPQPASVLAALAGRWTLATTPPRMLDLRVEGDALIGRLEGESVRWTFQPASATHYVATERPFELRVEADGRRLSLVTWATPTAAVRAGP